MSNMRGHKGYMILLHYISLHTAEDAIDRIGNRVKLGGHDISKEDVGDDLRDHMPIYPQ